MEGNHRDTNKLEMQLKKTIKGVKYERRRID